MYSAVRLELQSHLYYLRRVWPPLIPHPIVIPLLVTTVGVGEHEIRENFREEVTYAWALKGEAGFPQADGRKELSRRRQRYAKSWRGWLLYSFNLMLGPILVPAVNCFVVHQVCFQLVVSILCPLTNQETGMGYFVCLAWTFQNVDNLDTNVKPPSTSLQSFLSCPALQLTDSNTLTSSCTTALMFSCIPHPIAAGESPLPVGVGKGDQGGFMQEAVFELGPEGRHWRERPFQQEVTT